MSALTVSRWVARGRRSALAMALGLACVAATSPASAAARSTTCQFGGPAGTASVVRLVLRHPVSTLALRVTTPTSLGARPSDVVGTRSSWHLVTGLMLVATRTDRLVASRFVQSGSSPRRAAVSADGEDVRADDAAPGAPFNHVGGDVPDRLPAGVYDAVAFGSDGDPALPNPWWSAELAVGAAIDCAPMPADVRIFDHDGTDFRGGTQVNGYGAGHADGASLTMRPARGTVAGLVDAERQFAGSVQVRCHYPGRNPRSVTDSMVGFAGPAGRYAFTASYDGVFPLVLVAGVTFRLRG